MPEGLRRRRLRGSLFVPPILALPYLGPVVALPGENEPESISQGTAFHQDLECGQSRRRRSLICTEALAKGELALYPESMMEPIPKEYRRRYIAVAKDPNRREFRIAPKLRGKVRFERLNLIDAQYPFGRDFDIVFLRNVLITFDQSVQQHIVRLLVSHLRPGGHLLLGRSESLAGTSLPLTQVANTIFRRRCPWLERSEKSGF